MTINRSCQQSIWQNITSHMDELQQLESQLREMDKQREGLQQQIEVKQRVIAQATGLTWAQVAASLASPSVRRHSGQNRTVRARTASITTVRAWVLRAIAHYEDENPQSRIDENSIRIFINAEGPGLLDHHSPNVLFGALNALKSKGIIITTPRRGANHDRSQYRLTALGRASLI